MVYVEVGAWSGLAPPPGAVVVGYNGKGHSRAALRWGVAEAVRREAPVLVLYAANYPGMTGEAGSGLLEREPGALEAAQEVTALGVSEALDLYPVLSVAGATEVSSPVRALTEASRGASLVVLGSRGHGRVLGALLGSVAFNVAARSECPVVVVKDETVERPVGPEHPVVVGTDGSSEASAAVTFAAGRARAASAVLDIVTCTGGPQGKAVDEATLRASAERIGAEAASQVRDGHAGLVVTTRVEDAPPERILVDASTDAGMVVVGRRGRGAFEGMLLGSVSHAVIHGAGCAVAVVGEGQA